MESRDDAEGMGLMESTPTAIAAEFIRTLLARFRAARGLSRRSIEAAPPDAEETSRHQLGTLPF